jgi:hypothetical protein
MALGGWDHDVITGIHAVVFSPRAEKVRGFLAGTLGMPSVDDGWGLFAAIRMIRRPACGSLPG